MSGGICTTTQTIENCECGNEPELIWHYIKGVANKIHYFVRCKSCRNRTNDRKKLDDAISEWNLYQWKRQNPDNETIVL